MKVTPSSLISSCMELTIRDEEKKYEFYTRSGMALSEGATLEEADRRAYFLVFGVEFDA